MTLHPLVSSASVGDLPDWAAASPERREHMERVAVLLESWAGGLGLGDEDRERWRAAGYLHDALRDERPEVLRDQVPPELRDWPGLLLHGPAAAQRISADGVEDEDLLVAVSFHTVGDPSLGALGRALYAADFLEPGRAFLTEWRAELRHRMPDDLDAVVREIVRARIQNRLDEGLTLLSRTVGFWNALLSA